MSTPVSASDPAAASAAVATADPVAALEAAFRTAIVAVLGPGHADADPAVRPSGRPEHGDFQVNGAMALAKRARTNPRELAAKLIEAVDVSAIAEPPEIAGPGFINIRLRPEALAAMLAAMDEPGLGVRPATSPHSVVVDMCAVNVAKEMHVGHLRSSIIGDTLARTFGRLGRTVHRENHLGDWGLPIAMVLWSLRRRGVDLDTLTVQDLNAAYRDAQLTGRADVRGLEAARTLHAGPHRIAELEEQNAGAEEATAEARRTLVGLQSGDEQLLADWHRIVDVTLGALFEALAIMDVRLGPEHNRGESFYRDRLADTISAYEESGLAEVDDGALVVRFEDRERPLIIRKRDGGFIYATTDLAAVRFRTQELDADRVIYVVDHRQRDHFRDVFDAVRKIGWDRLADGTPSDLRHVGFGAVLGQDGKPLKTRSGENVTLRSLLDEAVARGVAQVRQRAEDPESPTHDLSEEDILATGRAVGMAAVKYADLSNDLSRDYVFDMDRMVAFEGDTGPYLQYAHARICSIFARSGVDEASLAGAEITLGEPAEKQLALMLLRYPAVVEGVADSLEPHRLCGYLFELAGAFSSFYQQCPVLKVDEPLRSSRLRLCSLVRRVLDDGLELLGIERPARM
jgi:arginyl-tRNA synthetase